MKEALELEWEIYQALLDLHNLAAEDPQVQNLVSLKPVTHSRRGQQRERQKNSWFNKQNNNFARASRFFVHFFPVFARLRRENA